MSNTCHERSSVLPVKFVHRVPHQAGHSGKTVPELEKTIGLMKKVVERVQRENDTLKKSSAPVNQEKITSLEQENQKLKVLDHTISLIPKIFLEVL